MVRLDGRIVWVNFKYERCPDFCYHCGIIGHFEKNCNLRENNINKAVEPEYENWLKAGSAKTQGYINALQDGDSMQGNEDLALKGTISIENQLQHDQTLNVEENLILKIGDFEHSYLINHAETLG
ncbi:hypothetical protein ACH5RR_039098 [Cinchona calisaya]|uniref:CCHC-type domain-containing protein n=1 Tax=Cinchona calisaya TaxID=153742 RepID=A0ABD2Y2J9_9GENT